ncbi:MAG: phosphate ABC transporter substrate-binding protein [Candidatus Omnitrophica bacterium 4484_70.2]|nr:MAG: phosphate ABC transporter substrate-binding protein [Candidatus Omnitrophica bacterium 4484_70.2]
MKKVILIWSFITFLGLSFVYAEKKKLVIQGSTTVLPIAQKCAEVFMQKHPEADISVRGGGSGTGIAALIDGICDIADSSRPMKKKEIIKAKEKGVNPEPHVIAMDGIAVIIHPSNPVNELTLSQLKEIYTGKISNWSQLGGKNQKIVVISRDVASGTFECFNKLVLKKKRVRPDALLQASNAAVLSVVKRTKGAIGYVGLGYLSSEVKALKIEGVIPSEETVLKGIYPLSRPLFMYTNGKPKELAKDFIDFVLSKEGQKIVKEQGFVPLK